MSEEEILKIIAGGESSTVEFKRKSPGPLKLAKEISALANTKGGYLFIGVDDNKKLYGIHSEKTEKSIIETAAYFHIEPTLDLEILSFNISKKEIVVAIIPDSINKPHKVLLVDENNNTKKRAYIRVGEKSVEASSEMARLMTYQNPESGKELKLSITEKEQRLFRYLEKYERVTVKDYCKLTNISKRRAERSLVQLVRAGIIQIHHDSAHDYFTLVK